MMNSLWDYLTQPSRANTPINKDKYLDETMYTATAVPRFLATGAQSVYDSFKRGIQPYPKGGYIDEDMNVLDPRTNDVIRNYSDEDRIADAFNVAGGAMTGSMPFAPKGAGTLGTVRRPQDIVIPSYLDEFLNYHQETTGEVPSQKFINLASIYNKYFSKSWATKDDELVKYIENGGTGHRLPFQPVRERDGFAQQIKDRRNGLGGPLVDQYGTVSTPWDSMHRPTAKTPEGIAAELLIDNTAYDGIRKPWMYEDFLHDMPKQLDYLTKNKDARLFDRPQLDGQLLAAQAAILPGNLNRMSLTDLLQHVDNTVIANERAATKNVEKLHAFDDGHYWTQLKTQAQRDAESDAMGNSTRLPMHDGKELYSLRDKNGKSILTASRNPKYDYFDEIKDRFNNNDILGILREGSNDFGHKKYTEALRDALKITRDKWPDN